MTWLDGALIGAVLLFAGVGALRGFVGEVLSLVAWVLAGLIAWMFADDAAGWFRQVSDADIRRLLGFSAVFTATFVVLTLVNFFVRFAFFKDALRPVDRSFGAALGTLRGLALAVVLVMAAGLTSFPRAPWWQESVLIGYFETLAVWAAGYLPPDIARQVSYS